MWEVICRKWFETGLKQKHKMLPWLWPVTEGFSTKYKVLSSNPRSKKKKKKIQFNINTKVPQVPSKYLECYTICFLKPQTMQYSILNLQQSLSWMYRKEASHVFIEEIMRIQKAGMGLGQQNSVSLSLRWSTQSFLDS
jgi:hypothetical protein